MSDLDDLIFGVRKSQNIRKVARNYWV